jgi:predicted ArsR family transcriptional regulator
MHWYGIPRPLAGSLSGVVTPDVLALAVGVEVRIASAWLGKFARWGYVVSEKGGQSGRRGRPQNAYRLTRWGLRFRPAGKVLDMPKKVRTVANPNPKKEDE